MQTQSEMKYMKQVQTRTNSKSIAWLTLTPTLQEITLVRHEKKKQKTKHLEFSLGWASLVGAALKPLVKCRPVTLTVAQKLIRGTAENESRGVAERRQDGLEWRWIETWKCQWWEERAAWVWGSWRERGSSWDVSLRRVQLNSLNVHWICFYYTLMSHAGHEGSGRCLQWELKASAAWRRRHSDLTVLLEAQR